MSEGPLQVAQSNWIGAPPSLLLTEACSAWVGQWDAAPDSLIRARPGFGELGSRVSTLQECQAAHGWRGLKATSHPEEGTPGPGHARLLAEQAKPSPNTPQLPMRVLPRAFPSQWPPGAMELGLHCLWVCGGQMGGRGSATGVLFGLGRMT